jgi:hypothetical protein
MLLAIVLRRLESMMAVGSPSVPLLNKPGMWLEIVISSRSGRLGDEQASKMVISGGIGEVLEVSPADVSKRRRGAPPLSLTEGVTPRLGSFGPDGSSTSIWEDLLLQLGDHRQAYPKWFVPGGTFGGRCTEAWQWRWWRRTGSRFRDFHEVLFVISRALLYLPEFFKVLCVIVSHRYE